MKSITTRMEFSLKRRVRFPMTLLLLAAAGSVMPPEATGQVTISGQLDLVATAARDSLGLNTAFRGDNPFNPVRLRLFARSWVTEDIGIFGELLYDMHAAPRVNGAYMVINNIADRPWLGARLGLAPSVVGTFGLRSTYFNSNPLIGIPLIWGYRTNLDGGGRTSPASIGAAAGPGRGAPLLYDTCWNVQWELLGEFGAFEYSLGVTAGSLSNPMRSRAVPGSQWMARLGYAAPSGLRLGVSAAHGPYLSKPEPDAQGALPYADDPASFDQTLVGVDLEWASGRWVVHSEAYRGTWETPLIQEQLDVTGGYVKARFDVLPGWYLAGRAGMMDFGDIATDPAGSRADWDRDVRRTELTLGYRLAREVLLKLDWQRNSWDGLPDAENLLAIQLSSVF